MPPIIGVWVGQRDGQRGKATLNIRSNGTYNLADGSPTSGTWKQSGRQIELHVASVEGIKSKGPTAYAKLSEDQKRITLKGKNPITLTKP